MNPIFTFIRRSALFLAAALLPLAAQAQDITHGVAPNIVAVGEPATYTVTFHNANAADFSLHAIDGLQFSGPSHSSQQSIVNGHISSTASRTYRVFPLRPGRYEIAPRPFTFNGQTVTLAPAVLEVRPAASADPDDPDAPAPLRLRATLDPPAPYVHQTALLTLEILTLPNVNIDERMSLHDSTLPASGCIHSDFMALDPDRIDVDGTLYDRRRFQAALRFTSSGTFSMRPGLRVNVLTRNQQAASRRRDPFDDMMFDFSPFGRSSAVTATPVDIAVPETIDATVRAVPKKGRPADYSGAVGRFTFTASASPVDVHVGEPVTVSVALSGDGNIADARPAFFTDTVAYKAYEAKLSGDAPAPESPGGIKRFDQVVIPRSDALMELPALSFSYFDPVAETFKTATAGPFPLHVSAADGQAAGSALLLAPGAAAASGASPAALPPATLVLADDIHYLQPVPAIPPLAQRLDAAIAAAPLHATAALLAPAVLLLALHLLRLRHERLAGDTAALRRHKAPRSARRHIQAAETALKSNAPAAEVAAHLSAAASSYFAHRLNLPPGAADPAFILHTLEKAPDAASDLPAWRDTFALIDNIRYASMTPSRDDLETAIATLAALLRRAERISL